ncbi:MAG: 50S ribosomal protein L25 [Endomicrobiales bacterium]|nr:50S ribosomal protein L25 [Endomicrobiales bacterium]
MNEVLLEAQVREVGTKHKIAEIRNQGGIPCVVYGVGEKNIVITINAKSFDKLLHSGAGRNTIINLKIGSISKTAIVKEIQRDMLTQTPIHVDFHAISLQKKIEVSVPVHVIGIATGVKLSGGVMEHVLREIKVSCLPTEIPKSINVDVSALEIGQSITVKDLPEMKGVDLLEDASGILVNIVAPTILEEKPVESVAGVPEPEVITKGKKDETAEGAATVDDKGKKPAETPAKK